MSNLLFILAMYAYAALVLFCLRVFLWLIGDVPPPRKREVPRVDYSGSLLAFRPWLIVLLAVLIAWNVYRVYRWYFAE